MGDYWRFCARVMGSELKRCVNDNCPPLPPATWKQISKPYHNFHAFYEKLWMAAGGKSNSAKPTAYNSWRANSNILKLIIQSSRAVSELFLRSFFLLFFEKVQRNRATITSEWFSSWIKWHQKLVNFVRFGTLLWFMRRWNLSPECDDVFTSSPT